MTENQIAIITKDRERSILNRRNAFAAAGIISAAAAGNTHAAISSSDVTGLYTSTGASDTIDGVGLAIISLVIGLTVVGIIISLVKKK